MRITFDSMLAWFLVSLGAIAIATVTAHLFNKRSKRLTLDLEKLTAKHSEAVTEIIRTQLSPTIHLHDGLDQVTKRVAEIIKEVCKMDDSDRTIDFFGAASLAAPEDDRVVSSTSVGNEVKRSSELYEEAIGEAQTANVRLKRYISLFTKEEQLTDRSERVQERYLAWLNHQAKLLNNYSQYELAHVVRAPNWGSNMARIITKKHVMEITGNGKAAIVITDKHIAERIRQYAYDSVIGKSPKNPIQVYGRAPEAASVSRFIREYVEVAKRALKQTQDKQKEEKAQNESEQSSSERPDADN